MPLLLSSLIVAGVLAWASSQIVGELKKSRAEAGRARMSELLALFAPATAAVQGDPRTLLTWQPIARTARQLFPDEFAALDRASTSRFPFSAETIQAAHAKWTTDWLEWERSHDAEYKLKAAMLEQEIGASVSEARGSPVLRARLEAVEQEKLDLYQQRYAEYIRVAKSLQAFVGDAADSGRLPSAGA